jgi:cytochrome c oxidase cbb3-type subunit 1
MDRFSKAFVIASLIYSVIGASLGLFMAWPSPESGERLYYFLPSHTHLNLIGWVSMMIYGVAYHVIPRLSGRPIYSKELAWMHFALSQLGLVGMAVFFALNRIEEGRWGLWLAGAGTLMFISILVFVFNMLMTLTTTLNLPPVIAEGLKNRIKIKER